MRSNDLPVGSVSGSTGWDTAPDSRIRSESPTDGTTTTREGRNATEGRTYQQRVKEYQRQIDALEKEIELKDRQLQSVITHYERLYSELRDSANKEKETTRDIMNSFINSLF